MYLIFMCLSLVCWVVVYLWSPETRRLPLEAMGALFGDKVVLHLTADGLDVVEKEMSNQEHDSSAPTGASNEKDSTSVVHDETVKV